MTKNEIKQLVSILGNKVKDWPDQIIDNVLQEIIDEIKRGG